MSTLLPWPRVKFFVNNTNAPLSGGKVYTYAAGTSTPLASFQDEALTTPNTNPVILDANGEANIHLSAASKINVFDASNVQVPGYPIDNISTDALLIASVYAAFANTSNPALGVALVGGAGRVVDSIAALRLVTKANNSRVFVSGYYAVGDGGGGQYWYDPSDLSSSDNAITTIVAADGGRWKLIIGSSLSVKQAGAKGDGSTNDTAAILATMAAARLTVRRVFLPRGTYCYSTALDLDVELVGDGAGYNAWNNYLASVGSILKWVGSAVPAINVGLVNFGSHGLTDIALDCNSLATIGVNILGGVGGKYKNIFVKGFTSAGLWIDGGSQGTGSWNDFNQLRIDGPNTGAPIANIVLTSWPVTFGNACHNTFTNTLLNHAGTGRGIYLAGADNNCFTMTYINRAAGGTGIGVEVDPTIQAGMPVNNVFLHLQAGAGGWSQPVATTSQTASIYGYMTDNGQPNPVINGGYLFYIMDSGLVNQFNVKEKGTWTPTTSGLTFVGANNSVYKYVKTGNVVQVNITIAGATSVAITAGATISLPFTAAAAGTGICISANDVTKASNVIAYNTNAIIATACVAEPSYTISFAYTV